MPTFKFVISDPKVRKAYNLEADQNQAMGLMGKKIGETFNGDILGLKGYELQITGGADKDGFPMHPSVHGPGRKSLVLSQPPGFHPKLKGERKRKTVRGNTISQDTAQINCKVAKVGAKPLDQLLAKVSEAKPEEKPKEETKVEKKEPSKKAEEKPKAEKDQKPSAEKK